jgi:predicted porin
VNHTTGKLSLCAWAAVFCGWSAAQAQSAPAAPPLPAAANPNAEPVQGGLTWNGISLYGIIDLGLQYDTHAAPFNDYFAGGSADIVQKNSNHAITGVTPNNLTQSRIGLQGIEPLVDGWSAIFKLETFFNPQSGQISDGLHSLVQNNGRALDAQTTNLDSSVAGQAFQQAFAGFSSPRFGTITFGRQNTVLADGILKYDPNNASQAFSLVGLSGTTAGGGDTEDRRLDSSLKYVGEYDGVHLAALYKLSNSSTSANSVVQAQVGYEIAGLSVDYYYSKVKDAISAAALSAAQVLELPGLGFSPNNSLAATISDNTTFGFMGLYTWGPVKFYASYDHIRFDNPQRQLAAGFDDIGGYKLAFVNNTAFPNDKILQVYWAGVKYSVNPSLEVTAAYYGYRQNSYGIGDVAGCSTTVSAECSGNLQDFSMDAIYKLSKRFDAYAGFMYSLVQDGLANGYLNKNNINPTIGIRFRF